MDIELIDAVEENSYNKVTNLYPKKITEFVQSCIDNGIYSEEAASQYIPSDIELVNNSNYSEDACNEGLYKINDMLIHKYENRVALMLTNICFVYCRFCFRKALVGQSDKVIKYNAFQESLEYIKNNKNIVDILLTGGDPLILKNPQIKYILDELSAIDHVISIRFDTRVLTTQPSRIDDELIDILKINKKVWIHAHINHPDEIKPELVKEKINIIQANGIPIVNQFVLLKGVNDSWGVLKKLLLSCYENRILPYNMYKADDVKGTSHFHVDDNRIIELINNISNLPGPAQPAFVIVDKDNMKQRALFSKYLDLNEMLTQLS